MDNCTQLYLEFDIGTMPLYALRLTIIQRLMLLTTKFYSKNEYLLKKTSSDLHPLTLRSEAPEDLVTVLVFTKGRNGSHV